MSKTRQQTPVDPLDAITQSIQQLTTQMATQTAQMTAQISALDAKFTDILDQQQVAFTQASQRQDQTITSGLEAQSATIDALSAQVDDIDSIIESKLANLQLDDKLTVLDSKLTSLSSTTVSNDTLLTIFTESFKDDHGSFSPERLRSFLEQSDDADSTTASITTSTVQQLIDQALQSFSLPATMSSSSSALSSRDPPDAILAALSSLIASHRRHTPSTSLRTPSSTEPFLSSSAFHTLTHDSHYLTLDLNLHLPAPTWPREHTLQDTSVPSVYAFFTNCLTYTNRRPVSSVPINEAIHHVIIEQIIGHSTNHTITAIHTTHMTYQPLDRTTILHPASLPAVLTVLAHMSRPHDIPSFLTAFTASVQFPNPIVYGNASSDIPILISSLHIYFNRAYAFFMIFKKADVDVPLNEKEHGFLRALYHKIPLCLVEIAHLQRPYTNHKTPRLADILTHFNKMITVHLQTPHLKAANYSTTFKTAPAANDKPSPLQQVYPAYTPKALSNAAISSMPHNPRQPYNTPWNPHNKPTPLPTAPPAQAPPRYPQQSQAPYPPRHHQLDQLDPSLHHLDPSYPTHQSYEQYEDNLPTPDASLFSDSDDDDYPRNEYPTDVPPEPLQHEYPHYSPESQRDSMLHFIEHRQHQHPTLSKEQLTPSTACYRMLWSGQCSKPNSCRWSHAPADLRNAWYFHKDLLNRSSYSPHSQTPPPRTPQAQLRPSTSAEPRTILPRHAPYQPRHQVHFAAPQHPTSP